jgi:hypothetical protein
VLRDECDLPFLKRALEQKDNVSVRQTKKEWQKRKLAKSDCEESEIALTFLIVGMAFTGGLCKYRTMSSTDTATSSFPGGGVGIS